MAAVWILRNLQDIASKIVGPYFLIVTRVPLQSSILTLKNYNNPHPYTVTSGLHKCITQVAAQRNTQKNSKQKKYYWSQIISSRISPGKPWIKTQLSMWSVNTIITRTREYTIIILQKQMQTFPKTGNGMKTTRDGRTDTQTRTTL